MRTIDKFTMHAIVIPALWLSSLKVWNVVEAYKEQTALQSADVALATLTERGVGMEKRLDSLERTMEVRFSRVERVQDGIFATLLGVFVALILNIRSQRQRRDQPEKRR